MVRLYAFCFIFRAEIVWAWHNMCACYTYLVACDAMFHVKNPCRCCCRVSRRCGFVVPKSTILKKKNWGRVRLVTGFPAILGLSPTDQAVAQNRPRRERTKGEKKYRRRRRKRGWWHAQKIARAGRRSSERIHSAGRWSPSPPWR